MTLDELRKDMEEWLERSSSGNPRTTGNEISGALVELYGRCDQSEKALAIQVMSEWVLSGDESTYFIASMALEKLKIYDSGTLLRMRLESGPRVRPRES